MKKLIYSFVMSLTMVAASVCAQAATFVVDGVNYTTTTDTTVSVARSSYSGAIVIPEAVTYNGSSYQVTAIDTKAFYECTGLTAVTLPPTLQRIGTDAFYYCTALTAVNIPAKVQNIENEAFYCCVRLNDLVLNEGVKTIGESAFEYTAISQLNLPESVTTLKYGAFGNCPYLTNVHIPKGLTSIADYAFYACEGLEAFTVDPDNTKYTAIDGLLMSKDGKKLLAYPNAKAAVAQVPEGVTSLANGAFWYCLNVEQVQLPSTLTSIGQYAFWSCENMARITLPESLKTISNYAFMYCSLLDSVVVPNSVTSFGTNVFYSCTSLTAVQLSSRIKTIGQGTFQGCTSLATFVVPESVTSLGTSAFAGSGLQHITFSSVLKTLGSNVFYACKDLTEFVVPDDNATYTAIDGVLFSKDGTKLTYYPNMHATHYQVPDGTQAILANAFGGCDKVQQVVMPSSVIQIGQYAFSDCSALTNVTIGSGVTVMGDGVFDYCKALAEIHSRIVTPFTVPANVFNKVDRSKCTLYVPVGSLAAYRATPAWNSFSKIVEEADAVLGDLNGDGQVDISDVNAVINMMLGKSPQTPEGDLTGDGNVDISDVNAVINLMLGK